MKVTLRSLAVNRIALAISTVVLASFSHAADKVWDFDADPDDHWSNGLNWLDNSQPQSGDAIFFGPSAASTSVNDLAANTSFSGITFNSGLQVFAITLSGSAVQLTGGITNLDNNNQTISLNVSLTANIGISAENASSGNINMNGVIGESGGTYGFTKTGARTLNLNAVNTYSGGTTLKQGTITLGISDALGTGGFNFAGGTLNANNKSDSTIGALTLTANSILNLSSGGTAGTLTFDSASWTAGNLTINNWTGTAGNAGTDDRIFVTANPGATFLSHVNFTGFDPGAEWLSGEIVPLTAVPEPTEWALIIFAFGAVAYKFGPRLRKSLS